MEELQIASLENTDISGWDLAMLKAQLEKELDFYKGMVYTDDSIRSAKDDRKTLNGMAEIIEKKRKAYKAKCLAPYTELEPQIKELVDMIKTQSSLIDNTVKDYENRQRAAKEAEVRAYYDKKAFVLGNLAEKLYEKLLDKKWLNASAAKSKYKEGIQIAINNALADINTIKAMDSPFVDTLLDIYVETLSMDQVNAKNAELIAAHDKAGFKVKDLTEQVQAADTKQQEAKPVANPEEGTLLKVYATQDQLNQVTDFMKAIGVTYEIQ